MSGDPSLGRLFDDAETTQTRAGSSSETQPSTGGTVADTMRGYGEGRRQASREVHYGGHNYDDLVDDAGDVPMNRALTDREAKEMLARFYDHNGLRDEQSRRTALRKLAIMFIINGTGRNTNYRGLEITVNGRTQVLDHGPITADPSTTVRRFARSRYFADFSRDVIRANVNAKSGWCMDWIARRKLRPDDAEIGFDYADGCSGLQSHQVAAIEAYRRLHLEDSGDQVLGNADAIYRDNAGQRRDNTESNQGQVRRVQT